MGRLGEAKLLNQCDHSLPHLQPRAPLSPPLPWSGLEELLEKETMVEMLFSGVVSSHFVLQALSASAVLGRHAAGSSGNGCHMT